MGNKVVGIVLAACSGLFIGVSFVFKKKGLLNATANSGKAAGEGFAYLKNWVWWSGLTLMIIGEICNFVAYAFTEAILVTPLGALSVVVAAIGSSIVLKERLSFVGKVGCFQCILGAIIIVMNAPEQPSVSTIQEMKHYVISKVFLPYVGVVILLSLFLTFWVGPRYGQTNVFVYISICSLIGGISVVCTQGFGASVVSAISGVPNQWNNWFLWILFLFVACTLVTEIIFLNKALNIFNTSIVTPIYFTCFTTMTIVSSAILFQGFNGSAVSIVTVILGFFCIVSGVVLLQISLAAQTKPDSQILKAELNDVQDVLQAPVDDDALNPGPASIRGALSIRRFATRKVSSVDQLENLRRRQTLSSQASTSRSAQPSYRPSAFNPMTNFKGITDEHKNTIKFVPTGRLNDDMESSITEGVPYSFYQGQHLPLHIKDEYLPRVYASEMERRPAYGNVDLSTISQHSQEADRPTSKGSRASSRMKKQFSFAVRGRTVQSEEERVGLTSGEDGHDMTLREHSSRSASETSDGDIVNRV